MSAVDPVSVDPVWEPELAAVARARISVRWKLGALVLGAAVAHALLAYLRLVPTAFPDEYLYAALGRSIAAGHLPSVRGTAAHFPALLQPLLTAPAWLLPRVELSLRAIQTLNAVAVALAAVPAYLLARKVRLGESTALAVAALAVVVPQLSLASQVLSEPIAYPLALGAVAAAVALVERPGRRATVVFLVLAVLAGAARVQLAVLPLCALVAVVADGLRAGGVRPALRRQRVLVAFVALEALAALGLAATGRVGYYATLLPSGSALAGGWKLAPSDLYVLVLSAGIVIAPAGLVGGALALVRPRFRAELAFGVVSASFLAALLAQACLYGDTDLLQERYLFYAVPLLAVAFGLRMTRRPRGWQAEASVAAAIATFAGLVPLAGYVAAQTSPAPLEGAVRRLQLVVGDPGTASLVVALAATLGAAVGIAAASRRRWVAGALLGASILVAAVAFGGGVSWERTTNVALRHGLLPADLAWIDHSGVRAPAFLAAPGSQRSTVLETLFWNRRVDRVLLLPGAKAPDKFAAPQLAVDGDGRLLLSGRTISTPLVVDSSASTVQLREAKLVREQGPLGLWRPAGADRLGLMMWGRLANGMLLNAGGIWLWPDRRPAAGWVTFQVRSAYPAPGSFTLFDHDRPTLRVAVRPNAPATVRVPFCGGARFARGFESRNAATSAPRYVPDAAACR